MTKRWTRIFLLVAFAILMQSGRAAELADSTYTVSSTADSTISTSSTDSSSSSVASSTDSSDSSSSSVASSTDSSDSSSSSVASSTDSNTLTSDSTNPVKSTTTDTPDRPLLTGKELFIRTGEVLDNISGSLDDLQKLLEAESREKSHAGPLHLTGSKVNRFFSQKDVGTKADMCLKDTPPCIAIEQSLSKISNLTGVLADYTEVWNDNLLSQLENENEKLAEAVGEAVKDDFDVAVTKETIDDVKQQVSAGSQVASERVEEFEQAEQDSVIFTSVLGTFGGLMVLGLLGAVIFAVVKGKKVSKTKESKGYNQVPEERIPVGDFIRAHDDPPPARSTGEASRLPHARSDYATPYAPDAPANRDPYARGRSPGGPRPAYSQGRSGGLTRHY
ncbi:serine-rich adhesin for platelets-like isoform X3 [Penaeus monodon]|uniref:serine-rich adhesin for platelets-like isoform X3 n=1 Tax=Penaeus monodon TaxID=6687 RepID=UPI0018A6FEF9|nr:serine-rich adhesin for platelets-like isoform X3 [Penaeus monodon]